MFAIVACLIAAGASLLRGGQYHHAEEPAPPSEASSEKTVTPANRERSSMRVEWYGQSAFQLSADGTSVVIDPFGDMSALAAAAGSSSTTRRSPASRPDLLLVTHEHGDHNGVEAIGGEPAVAALDRRDAAVADRRGHRRSPPSTTTRRAPSAGRTRSSCSRSTACASATSATSARARCARSRRAAIGEVDLLFLPVGGGPTIGAEQAALDRRAAAAALGRADALPHAADRLPRDGRRVPRERSTHVEHRRAERVRDGRAAENGDGPLVVVPAAP